MWKAVIALRRCPIRDGRRWKTFARNWNDKKEYSRSGLCQRQEKGKQCQIQNGGTQKHAPRAAAHMTSLPRIPLRNVPTATRRRCRIAYAQSAATTKAGK